MVESPVTSRSSSLELMVQDQIKSALSDLRRLTKIPPTLKVLNNQVKKISSSNPLRSGQYSDIWLGEWLGETVSQSLATSTRFLTLFQGGAQNLANSHRPPKSQQNDKGMLCIFTHMS